MVNLDINMIRSRYSEDDRAALKSAFEILEAHKFFEFVVAENNRLLVEGFNNDSVETLTKKILDNRQTSKILLSVQNLVTLFEGENS